MDNPSTQIAWTRLEASLRGRSPFGVVILPGLTSAAAGIKITPNLVIALMPSIPPCGLKVSPQVGFRIRMDTLIPRHAPFFFCCVGLRSHQNTLLKI